MRPSEGEGFHVVVSGFHGMFLLVAAAFLSFIYVPSLLYGAGGAESYAGWGRMFHWIGGVSLCKPRRGGLFIARDHAINIFFLFFGGANAEQTHHSECSNKGFLAFDIVIIAPPKNKKHLGGVCVPL